MSPYILEGPAVISFSGGRTSAYLLHEIAMQGILEDVHILFANTGKERPETLNFVHECEARWGLPIVWLEYAPPTPERRANYRVVDYESASRNGEPFEQLIEHRKRLPNPLMRICTQELKIRPMREWMKDNGYDRWDMAVGLRADEPRRISRMRRLNDLGKERWQTVMPLAKAGVTEADVLRFWAEADFDLQLKTWEGNCDLCFLKAQSKRVRIIQERPDLLPWWLEQEGRFGEPFVRNGRSFAELRDKAKSLPVLQSIKNAPDDDQIDCMCTD